MGVNDEKYRVSFDAEGGVLHVYCDLQHFTIDVEKGVFKRFRTDNPANQSEEHQILGLMDWWATKNKLEGRRASILKEAEGYAVESARALLAVQEAIKQNPRIR